MSNYPGEYVSQKPGLTAEAGGPNLGGLTEPTLGSMFNYLGEYVQLPWGVWSTTLGSIFNYPGEYVQLPWGVCSTTLGSMFN